MTPQEALGILQQAAAKVVGTLQDHQVLQAALQVIQGALEAKPAEAPAPAVDE